MAFYRVNGDDLETVADAIRAKTGGSNTLTFPDGFAGAIDGMEAQVVSEYKQKVITKASNTVIAPNRAVMFSLPEITDPNAVIEAITVYPTISNLSNIMVGSRRYGNYLYAILYNNSSTQTVQMQANTIFTFVYRVYNAVIA